MDAVEGQIGWGIAGPGVIADKFATDFRQHIAPTGTGQLRSVASRDRGRAKEFADRHNIANAFGSHDELAADPTVDIVYVATLQHVHVDQVVRYLDAGKHVLVEKPIGLTSAEVDQMVAAAERNDRFLMEAMWMRFNPTHVEAYERIESGEIGEIRRVHADFSFRLPYDPDHRLWSAECGGSLLDLGVYPVTAAWWALGDPMELTGHLHKAPSGIDGEATLVGRWPDGATALLSCGFTTTGTNIIRIEGTRGTIVIDAPGHASTSYSLIKRETTQHECDPAGLHHQVHEVHRCLAEGLNESPRMPWDTSRAIIAALEEIRLANDVRYANDG